ncbi:MAG: hypothetical protein WAT39_06995 [Planctomycetota bacterium]
MKILVLKFEPSAARGEFVLKAPTGSVPLFARMSRMGEGEIVVAAPDDAKDSASIRFLSLWEEHLTQGGGDVANWRLLGSWAFSQGPVQHVFAEVLGKRATTRPSVDTPAPAR